MPKVQNIIQVPPNFPSDFPLSEAFFCSAIENWKRACAQEGAQAQALQIAHQIIINAIRDVIRMLPISYAVPAHLSFEVGDRQLRWEGDNGELVVTSAVRGDHGRLYLIGPNQPNNLDHYVYKAAITFDRYHITGLKLKLVWPD